MSLKPQIEAIIYATEEPVTLDQLALLLRDYISAVEQHGRDYVGVVEQQGRVQIDSDSKEPAAIGDHHALAAYDGFGDDDTAQSADDAQPDAASHPEVAETGDDTSPAGELLTPRRAQREELNRHKQFILDALAELTADYARSDRGIEIREVAGGYRMSTKPEHHDLVRAFAKGLKPPIKLSLPALETLAVIAYKQPVTAPEISEIRGVDTSGVLASLISRKLITTAGRKPVIGRPILYKTTREFLLRFGLKDLSELPSMEEFEKLTSQSDLFDTESAAASPQSERPEPPATALPDSAAEPDPFSVE